jgi:hypothetical protein
MISRALVIVLVLGGTVAADDDQTGPWLSQLTDQISNAWSQRNGAWLMGNGGFGGTYDKPAGCQVLLDKLAAANVPDTTTTLIRRPTPELTVGKHTLAEIKPACEHIRRAGLVVLWEEIALMAVTETPKLHAGGDYDKRYFTGCVQAYEKMIKAGISPSETVQEREVPDGSRGKVMWSGSIEDLRKKWCDAGVSKAGAVKSAEDEPYRKVLKADKLRLALDQRSFLIAGGAETSDPKKLAAATVWFVDLSRVDPGKPTCSGKDIHTVRRHQFDAAHKLVKTTEKEYCGSPPKSAFQ